MDSDERWRLVTTIAVGILFADLIKGAIAIGVLALRAIF